MSLIINEKLNSVQEHSQELPPAFCPHSCGVSIRMFVIIQNVFKPNWGLQGWERHKPRCENRNQDPHWSFSKFGFLLWETVLIVPNAILGVAPSRIVLIRSCSARSVPTFSMTCKFNQPSQQVQF